MKIDPTAAAIAFRRPVSSFDQAKTAFSDYLDGSGAPSKAGVFGANGLFGERVDAASTLENQPEPSRRDPPLESPAADDPLMLASQTAADHRVKASRPLGRPGSPASQPAPAAGKLLAASTPRTASVQTPAPQTPAMSLPPLGLSPPSATLPDGAAAPGPFLWPNARRQDQISILLADQDGGIGVVAMLAGFDPEAKAKVRDRVKAVLDEQGLTLSALSINGANVTDPSFEQTGGLHGSRAR